MTTPKWTDDDLAVAWQTGRDYQQRVLDEIGDDVTHSTLRPPHVSHEQRIGMRHADMLRTAAPDEYRGGPVPWEPARALPEWLERTAAVLAGYDRATLERGLALPALWGTGRWDAVRADVESSVWWRIWWDLPEPTRAAMPELAPATALRLGGDLE